MEFASVTSASASTDSVESIALFPSAPSRVSVVVLFWLFSFPWLFADLWTSLGLPSHLSDDVGALSGLISRDSLSASSGESHQMSNFLLALLSFTAGVVCCVIVQVVWEKHKEQQRKQVASQIFKPLISTLEQ